MNSLGNPPESWREPMNLVPQDNDQIVYQDDRHRVRRRPCKPVMDILDVWCLDDWHTVDNFGYLTLGLILSCHITPSDVRKIEHSLYGTPIFELEES